MLAKGRVWVYNECVNYLGERTMPFLQYKCLKCGKHFDELVKSYTDKVLCPDCKGETERDYSGTMYSSTGSASKKCSGNCKTCSGCR